MTDEQVLEKMSKLLEPLVKRLDGLEKGQAQMRKGQEQLRAEMQAGFKNVEKQLTKAGEDILDTLTSGFDEILPVQDEIVKRVERLEGELNLPHPH